MLHAESEHDRSLIYHLHNQVSTLDKEYNVHIETQAHFISLTICDVLEVTVMFRNMDGHTHDLHISS